jgi:hypothetical protein
MMNKQAKLLTALTAAAKKAANKEPLKAKIKKIKQKKSHYDWLAM